MTDFLSAQLERYTELVNNKMTEYFSDNEIPEDLREAMAYSVFAGGKRLRPALILASCEYCGGDINKALPFACAMEFIHTYSLIHDDLPAMDNDDYRRGRLTSHKKFGEDRAILAGDGLLSFAMQIMVDNICDQGTLNASRAIATGAGVKGMVAGQWVDVTLNGSVFDRKTMEYIHLNKTAAMIIAAAKAGAYCANCDEETVKLFEKYALYIGYTFQIIDDILDVEGDEKELGKAVGSDKENQKTTYVTLYGIEGARKEAKDYTEKAKQIFDEKNEKAKFFVELAEYLFLRKN